MMAEELEKDYITVRLEVSINGDAVEFSSSVEKIKKETAEEILEEVLDIIGSTSSGMREFFREYLS